MVATLLSLVREFLGNIGELLLLFLGVSFALEWVLLFFPERRIEAILLRRYSPLLSSFLGGVFGALTPFCSYSSVPLALAFLRFGVPFEAVVAFLLVSPLLNPILASFLVFLFGLKKALLYIVLVFSQTVLLGYLVSRAPKAFWVREGIGVTPFPGNDTRGVGSTLSQEAKRIACGMWDLAKSILPFLALGSAIGVLLEFFLPQDILLRVFSPQDPSGIFWVSLLGIPLYLRGEFVLPLGKALLDKGMNPGIIVAFLVSGAGGVSLPELALLLSAFRWRFILVFALLIFLLALEMGFVFFLLGNVMLL